MDDYDYAPYSPPPISRAERLRRIQNGEETMVGTFEGDEPWVFGLDPNENPQDVLARLARQYRAIAQEDEYDPVEVIRMHEFFQSSPVPDLPMYDSDTDSERSWDEPTHRIRPGPTFPPNRRVTIIGENGAAFDLLHDDTDTPHFHAMVVLLHYFQGIASSQTEYDGEQTMRQFIALMLHNGMTADAITRAYNFPIQSEEELEQHRLRNIVYDLEDELVALQHQIDIRGRAGAAAFANQRVEDPDTARLFDQHQDNALLMTDYPPRHIAILTWFSALTPAMTTVLDRMLDDYCDEAALIRRIRTARMATDPEMEIRDEIAEHNHEMFYDNGEEIEFGYENYHFARDGPPEYDWYGSAFFEVPDLPSSAEAAAWFVAAASVYEQGYLRTLERAITRRAYLMNRASIENWFNGAIDWVNTRDDVVSQDSVSMHVNILVDLIWPGRTPIPLQALIAHEQELGATTTDSQSSTP